MDLLEDRPISIRASLRKIHKSPAGEARYCLDFELERKHNRVFLLKETDPKNRRLRTLRSLDTSSDEVFEVAQSWLKECKCANVWDKPGEKWYPRRLLDLEEIRSANGLREIDGSTFLSEHSDLERKKVRLIESSEAISQKTRGDWTVVLMKSKKSDGSEIDDCKRENHRYVTLSHCWGKPKSLQGQLRLNNSTEARFKNEGIELRELSKTFRDAVLFACRMEKVGFIWIDSLCIKQPTASQGDQPGTSADDWLEQSRYMGKVYQMSFLNISATAAMDGDRGLFSNRKPEHLWEDEINVFYTRTNLVDSTRTGTTKTDQFTRCTLIDVSSWDELVEYAPVNRRGWVLQERLLAPRVLHFCHDQIAWDCAEFSDAEGHPEMNLTLRAKLGNIVDEGRLKDLTATAGLARRNIRLKGLADPDKDMPDLYMYELWKHIVETYSRMQLTVSHDKLIALSGIARLFCNEKFANKNEYIAGLWSNNLESQLLWQVGEVFRDGVFDNPARRDETRAPSFSWASIDSPYGITYPDVTDYGALRAGKKDQASEESFTEESNPAEELLLKVLDHNIVYADPQNPFGMVKGCKLLLRPRHLRRIELRRRKPPIGVPCSWCLKPASPDSSNLSSARPLEHSNLYLDTPESDVDIFKDNAQLYCMPVAYGERTVRKAFRYLYCLLLKYEGFTEFAVAEDGPDEGRSIPHQYRMFRRIGITKLSNHADEKGQRQLTEKEEDEVICLC
ncbi:heterokaryon incompatibility protein-domain-containing protein [Pyrenochaeta sp. MPI-SDFR-AT-0127]|nr:heterokaryon incompatibility protein-domain-containing protein [Pyrenochaeta sp. MPI-SDFR-AT-0127]